MKLHDYLKSEALKGNDRFGLLGICTCNYLLYHSFSSFLFDIAGLSHS
jgi:hypothetical protein